MSDRSSPGILPSVTSQNLSLNSSCGLGLGLEKQNAYMCRRLRKTQSLSRTVYCTSTLLSSTNGEMKMKRKMKRKFRRSVDFEFGWGSSLIFRRNKPKRAEKEGIRKQRNKETRRKHPFPSPPPFPPFTTPTSGNQLNSFMQEKDEQPIPFNRAFPSSLCLKSFQSAADSHSPAPAPPRPTCRLRVGLGLGLLACFPPHGNRNRDSTVQLPHRVDTVQLPYSYRVATV